MKKLGCFHDSVERTLFVLKNELSWAVVNFCVALQVY